MFLGFVCIIHTLTTLLFRKDTRIVLLLCTVIRYMLYYHCCLLVLNQSDNITDKLLRVVLEQIEFCQIDTL